MTTTRRHATHVNPGVRESTLDLLARANARGRIAPPVGSKPYDPPCRSCSKHAPTKLVGGVRQAYPCPGCGALRG